MAVVCVVLAQVNRDRMTWLQLLMMWPYQTRDRVVVMLAATALLAVGTPLLLFARQMDALGRSNAAWWWNRPMVAAFLLAAAGAIVLGVFGFYLLLRRPLGMPPLPTLLAPTSTPVLLRRVPPALPY